MELEEVRFDDFIEHLGLAEFQVAGIQDNNFDLTSNKSLEVVCEKSVELMKAVVEFLNSALIYFSTIFLVPPVQNLPHISELSQSS